MNPIPTVGILVFRKNQVLLVQPGRKSSHPANTYGLPAGRVEKDESDIDAAIRELKEETGLVVKAEDLVLVDKIWRAALPRKEGEPVEMLMHAFVAKNVEGQAQETDEATPVWMDIDKLSDLNLIPNVEDAVKEGIRLLNNE
jgi:8-oxo-dGTP diphosphatase